MKFNNLKYLHIIRGFAAFFVMLAHAKWPFWIGGANYLANQSFKDLSLIDKIGFLIAICSSNGTAMVIIFFVLSGFMIAHSYQKNKWNYTQFLVNRSLRIYIPYIASVLMAGGLLLISYSLAKPLFQAPLKDYHQGIAVASEKGMNFSNFFKTLLFYRSDFNYFGFNYVYWSLLYEMLFYLLFPLILRYYKVAFIFSALLYPIHFFYTAPEMNYFPVYFLLKFLLYFTSGVGLYQFIKESSINFDSYFFFRKRILQLLIISCFAGIVVTGFIFPKGISFILATLMAVLWICYILKYGLGKSIVNKALVFIGEISYSLYLVHVPLLLLLYALSYSIFNITEYKSPWIYLLFIIPVLPIAYAFYVVFEKFSFQLIQRHKKSLHIPVSTNVPLQPLKEL